MTNKTTWVRTMKFYDFPKLFMPEKMKNRFEVSRSEMPENDNVMSKCAREGYNLTPYQLHSVQLCVRHV